MGGRPGPAADDRCGCRAGRVGAGDVVGHRCSLVGELLVGSLRAARVPTACRACPYRV
jgi:hypothetical protein